MMEKPDCRKCRSKCVRNGKSKSGRQRYYCKGCKTHFQLEYLYNACQDEINGWITSLTKEGCGIRSIARMLGISVSTVIRKIKALGKSITRPFTILKGKEYEVDEMRTYIGNKKRLYWVAYAIRRDTREVIDFKVGKRTSKTLQKVIETTLLSDAKQIHTDGYRLYQNLIPVEVHGKAKYNINRIERSNLSIRTHLKRLSRKTICFSRSKEMLEACLKIYFWSGELIPQLSHSLSR